jgi:hypothetical protein
VAQGSSPKTSHLFAFSPPLPESTPPQIASQEASGVTETEVVLLAKLNPRGADTTYFFQYTTQAEYEAQGYGGAASVPVPEADAGNGASFTGISESVAGLTAGTAYRFRLVASNHCNSAAPAEECTTAGEGKPGEEGQDAAFATYTPETGLPDGRAYELVTPPDTNGRIPTMAELGGAFYAGGFNTALAAPDGESLAFGVTGGSIPGLGGGGYSDTYEALRGPDGWQSHFNGISGAQSEQPTPGGLSPDHDFAFWQIGDCNGTLSPYPPIACPSEPFASYIRRPGGVIDPKCSPEPGGRFELVGCGSLGTEPSVHPHWISAGGSHAIFATRSSPPAAPLEPSCAPAGSAVYDRTPDGVTHCISVKPGGSPFAGGEGAREYLGASADGTAVAFQVGATLYVRLDDATTVEAASGQARFGGLSADGARLVYLRPNVTAPLLAGTKIPQGEIFLCPVRLGACAGPEQAREPVQVGSGEESVLVNVSAGGSHVYFVSPEQLDGEEGTPGKDNLYLWDGESETVRFVATLTAADVEGRAKGPDTRAGGLGLWVTHALDPSPGYASGAASDPSRTTPEGSVLLFESHAKLSGYENAGRSEVYRYDSSAPAGERLTCVSCNPAGAAAASDAQLQSDFGAPFASLPPVNALAPVANLSDDGNKAFFQSAERLVNGDADGRIDVYEWEAQGTGGCKAPGGCIHLVSAGRSAGDDYLYAATPSGRDVFFESGDLLVPEDRDSTPSLYDAREGGGFPAPALPPGECLGEACQPAALAPDDPTPASSSFTGPGNPGPEPRPRCPKGKRQVRRHGKAHCAAKPHKHGRHHKRRHPRHRGRAR